MTLKSLFIFAVLGATGLMSCAETASDAIAAPPQILLGRSPEVDRDTVRIARVPDQVVFNALVAKYRVVDAEGMWSPDDQASPVQWWEVVPPTQPSGGFGMVISVGQETAQACLRPPGGPATTALTTAAFLVALPTSVNAIVWDGPCN